MTILRTHEFLGETIVAFNQYILVASISTIDLSVLRRELSQCGYTYIHIYPRPWTNNILLLVHALDRVFSSYHTIS